MITRHIAVSKKRHMANPKIPPPPSIFPYQPIYTKKFRPPPPIKAVFSNLQPPPSSPRHLVMGEGSDYSNSQNF